MNKKIIKKTSIIGIPLLLITLISVPLAINNKDVKPVSADIGTAKLKISNQGETTYGYIENTFTNTSATVIGVSFDISEVYFSNESSKLMPFTIDMAPSFGSRAVAADGGNGIQFLLAKNVEGIQFGPSNYNKVMTQQGYTYSVNDGTNVVMGAGANTWVDPNAFPFHKLYFSTNLTFSFILENFYKNKNT